MVLCFASFEKLGCFFKLSFESSLYIQNTDPLSNMLFIEDLILAAILWIKRTSSKILYSGPFKLQDSTYFRISALG